MHTTVAIAGAIVVVTKTEPNCPILVHAAPLNPYQPNHKINTPRHPIGMLLLRPQRQSLLIILHLGILIVGKFIQFLKLPFLPLIISL